MSSSGAPIKVAGRMLTKVCARATEVINAAIKSKALFSPRKTNSEMIKEDRDNSISAMLLT